jgi:hypothetical protein
VLFIVMEMKEGINLEGEHAQRQACAEPSAAADSRFSALCETIWKHSYPFLSAERCPAMIRQEA